MRGPALFAALLSLAASPAWCEDPVSTAPSAATTPAVPDGATPGPLGSDGYGDAGAEPGPRDACARGPAARGAPGPDDAAVHGQVEVGVGSDGYRHVGVYACKPVGGGSVAISVSHSEANWGGRR